VRSALSFSIALIVLSGTASAGSAPQWLRQAASVGPAAVNSSSAVILLDDVHVTVTTDGKLRTVRRYAVRVRDRAGREAAIIREPYITGSGKVRAVRGWVLRSSGDATDLGDDDVADVAIVNNDVYNEVRVKVLVGGDHLADGDVFGAEVESEERVLFSQIEWRLQERWPVKAARRRLTLPGGWRASSVTFNAPPLEGTSAGGTWTWETRDLQEIPSEEGMPPLTDLAPRLAVSFFGAEGSPSPGQFQSWREVAAWLDTLTASSASPAPAVAQKARELTASAATDFDRISAIAKFAQGVQYVSIQTGLGRGGGYQPRQPAVVLERNYGDCKDKASLVRAMLGALGVKSYFVSIFSGDANYVRAEWPSPQQFNHAIVAISIPSSVRASSVIEHPALGRLLIFDPTDEHTPVGELPLHEQGSLALIVSREGGGLERMPEAPPDGNKIARTLEGSIDATGAMRANVRQISLGAPANDARAEFRRLEPASYRASVERRLVTAVPGGRVARLDATDGGSGNRFELAMQVAAPQYAQPMGALFIVKPPLAFAGDIPILSGDRRLMPVVLEPRRVEESVQLVIAAGLRIDEVPAAVALETPFGRYALSYTIEGNRIVARRTLDVRGRRLPVSEFQELRAFFDKMRAADAVPIVLARK
jgi:hypothetical protein